MRKRKIKQISLGILTSLIVSIPIFISSNTYATGPLQPGTNPAEIFAASCATCHGDKGTGGVTWIKMSPADKRIAPPLVNLSASSIYNRVREGAPSNGMPAFGPQIITDNELRDLANFIADSPQSGVAPPAAPGLPADEIRLDILDADPWYTDRGADNAADPGDDIKRVALTTGQYLKIYNTGRTWHTFTRPTVPPSYAAGGRDSGFIGYAGNYDTTPGDLGDMGYYYADQSTDLVSGCNRYLCRMHPYMQVEVCTAGSRPVQSNAPLGLTRAHKHPLAAPTVFGIGEVWVTVQSQEELGEDTYSQVNNSVTGFDGTYQVINTATWTIPGPDLITGNADDIIHNVGNNPHNSYPGRSSAGPVVLSADWHDNTVVLMDATSKTIIGKNRSGGTNAHIFSLPDGNATNKDRFFVTHMGGNAIQEIDVDNGISNSGIRISGNTGPHGLWVCDDGQHILTADTFGGSATLYNVSGLYGGGTSTSASSGGASPLAPSIMSGFQGGCSRGFTNNALTADVSIYNITLGDPDAETKDAVARTTGWTTVLDPGGQSIKTGDLGDSESLSIGNIRLRNTETDQTGPAVSAFMARWANLPIQTPVSPGDATTHNQFMVTANKASFNVSITGLKALDGLPWGLFTIPAGLGAHGVTYGPKSQCDVDDNGVAETAFGVLSVVNNPETGGPIVAKCYYSYVSNTFEDYVSVYDLEKIDVNDNFIDDNGGVGMQGAGSALLAETAYVEGGAVEAVVALDPVVAGLCDALSALPGGAGATEALIADILDCGVGAMDGLGITAGGGDTTGLGALYVANLPIGVLCPDCRSGVHAGDVKLQLTTGEYMGGSFDTCNGTTDPCDATEACDVAACTNSLNTILPVTNDGANSKYTYVKDEVYVDTETIACALEAADGVLGICLGPDPIANGTDPLVNTDTLCGVDINDCDGNTILRGVPETDLAGRLNAAVPMDLELGINTGGQGITGAPAAFPFP